MSFDVFFQAFDRGEVGLTDAAAVDAVLGPYLRTAEQGRTRLETGDGSADLYGYETLESGFMVNHVTGDQVWELIVRAARVSRLAIMAVGCPIAVTAPEQINDLPAELQPDARVVMAGADLRLLIDGSE